MSKVNWKGWCWGLGWTLWILALLGALGRGSWLGLGVGFALLIGSGWFDMGKGGSDERD